MARKRHDRSGGTKPQAKHREERGPKGAKEGATLTAQAMARARDIQNLLEQANPPADARIAALAMAVVARLSPDVVDRRAGELLVGKYLAQAGWHHGPARAK